MAGGINLYAYTGNSPVNFTDPFGSDSRGANWGSSGGGGPNGQGGCSGGSALTGGCGGGASGAGVFAAAAGWSGAAGRAFQTAFNSAFNAAENGMKFFTNAGNTVPDLYAPGTGLGEIKAGQYVYNSTQIEAQIAAASEEGVPYYLVVSPTTAVAGTTATAVAETGGQVVVFDAAAGTGLPAGGPGFKGAAGQASDAIVGGAVSAG